MCSVQWINDHIAAVRRTIPDGVALVCVSKFHPASMIRVAYEAGERDFGESRVQELLLKHSQLPSDIRWHFIGHLQTNKVRAIIPFIHLIQSVDSLRLLLTIEIQAARLNRVVDVLLEVHVAKEETKSGFLPDQICSLLATDVAALYPHVRIRGIMGMATLTDNTSEVERCFEAIKTLRDTMATQWHMSPSELILSMGMSSDYTTAIEHGSTMVRIGTTIFGERN